MPMISGENINVFGGTYIEVAPGGTTTFNSPGMSGFDRLVGNVAPNALYDSGEVCDPGKCHPGTRVQILEYLVRFASSELPEFRIKWIYGPAGTGKTSIMRTLAEMLVKVQLLLASFFFFRASEQRNTSQFLIPTIAYQLCLNIPSVKPLIEGAIEGNPLIFTQSLITQARVLIINPITRAYKGGGIPADHARIIIVDGLDECYDCDRQTEVLDVLRKIMEDVPILLIIFVASRPESSIRDVFDNALNNDSSRLALQDSYGTTSQDMRKYFKDKFHDIQSRHPLRLYLPPSWPTSSVIDLLLKMASGQFVFASTVVKFIESRRHNPAHRLNVVLGLVEHGHLKPFEHLDLLYKAILQRIQVEPEELTIVIKILNLLLFSQKTTTNFYPPPPPHLSRTSPAFLESLLGLGRGEVRRLLHDLESLLMVPESDSNRITVYHASLGDFLADRSRSGVFHISPAIIQEELARRCVCLIHSRGVDNLHRQLLGIDFYIVRHIVYFLKNAHPTPELEDSLRGLDFNYLISIPAQSYGPPLILSRVCPVLLEGVKGSSLPNAGILHAALLSSYQDALKAKVSVYFDHQMTFLLVHPCIRQHYCLQPSETPHEDAIVFTVSLLFHISKEDLEADRENGFGILVNPEVHPVNYDVIMNIIGERQAACYTEFALRLLSGLKEYRRLPIHGSEPCGWIRKFYSMRGHNEPPPSPDIEQLAHILLSIVIPKCSIDSELTQLLQQPLILPEYHGILDGVIEDYLEEAARMDSLSGEFLAQTLTEDSGGIVS